MKQMIRPLAVLLASAVLALPSTVERRIGTPEFKSGEPSVETVQKV